MGSVISDIECPNCNEEANEDFNYRSGETQIFCTKCGYQYSNLIKQDKYGDVRDENGLRVYEEKELKNPYGVLYIIYKHSSMQTYISIENEKELNETKENMLTRREEYEEVTFSRFENGKFTSCNFFNL